MSSIGCAPTFPAETRAGGEHASCSDLSNWPGLEHAAGAIGVWLDGLAVERFSRYRDLLLDRTGKVNLTAIRDPGEIERRLFLDAVAMVPILDHYASERDNTGQSPLELIDIGSGAGFPGLALKIARPAIHVTLVDATGKKVAFLSEAIAALELDNVRAVHGRAEDLGHDPAFREKYAVATARAVASLPVLLEYVVPFLEPGGIALLPKGPEIDEELIVGKRAAELLAARIVSAELLRTGTTRLVVAEKVAATPAHFPRRAGVAARNPLRPGY